MEKSINAVSDVKVRDIGFLRGLIIGAAGFLLSCAPLFGRISPLAAALMCGLGGIECLFAFVGAAAGLAVSGGLENAVPYIAALIVIAALRFLLANGSAAVNAGVSAAAGICVFTANVFTANQLSDIFFGAGAGLVAGICAFCAGKLRSAAESDRITPDGGLAFCAGTVFLFVTAELSGIDMGIFNPGIFLGAIALLYASERENKAAAPITAIVAAAGIAAGNPDFAPSCIVLALSAPIVMFTGRYGRITRACGLILTLAAGMFFTGAEVNPAISAVSGTAAAVLYMAIPEKYIPVYKNRSRLEVSASPKPYAAFGKKLENMGSAVSDMRDAVIQTAEALDGENVRDISWVYQKASDKVCRSCPMSMKCWGDAYNNTSDVMNKAVAELKKGRFVDETTLSGIFGDCDRRTELAAALNKQYAVFCSAESAARKMAEMRSVLTSQLTATETILKKMAEELTQNEVFDNNAADKTEELLKEEGLSEPCAMALNIEGRLTIDAYCGSGELSAEELAEKLSFALRKEFDLPMISEKEDRLHITISERALYDAETKIFQKSKTGNRRNGDCCDCFNDGCGHVYMIISDGMGSGSRARIDSSFACGMLSKLLKAGIDMDASLEMLNTSLMVKSADESFATLDVCRIDLYTGEVLLYKAGGASTYVRCGGKFAEISGCGTPLGVTFGVDYSGKSFRLAAGDVVLMTSDGAEINTSWLEQLLLREKNADLEKIVSTVGEALKLSSKRDYCDDITLIGVKITK
ncbi:MAG: SpoIIE family protein phosphatase [Ruminiclostridium sp.]